ncbi:unnamed protein product [Owenia fusiformis]|uniref:HECT-type E3 ubiquitin transferase n=1 Tax=Owenia fusiformis TaxID=6347 RepID=A0A8J1TCH7_OWEFU|nr:unnamed protein product [Owenia fusiformis]
MSTENSNLARDGGLFAVPVGKPPKARHVKRGSLPDIARVKLSRHASQNRVGLGQNSASQSRLDTFTSNTSSRTNLNVKTLSASNLAALSDTNLSIKQALPARSYDAPNTDENFTKRLFDQLVKRYYYQLTEGCGSSECRNKFCRSAPARLKVKPGFAAVLSIELASRNKPYLCSNNKYLEKPLPPDIFKVEKHQVRPFLYHMFSTSPFKSLFQNNEKLNPSNEMRASFSLTQTLEGCLSRATSRESVKTEGGSNKGSLGDIFCTLNPARLLREKSKQAVNSRRGSLTLTSSTDERRHSLTSLVKSPDTSPERKSGLYDRQISSSTGNLNESGDDDIISSFPLTPKNLGADFESANDSANNSDICSIESNNSPLAIYGSNEDIADQLNQLEEFERQLSLEMNGAQEFSLTHLNIPMLQSAKEKCLDTGDHSFLINTIRTVFTSSEALNNSFKIDEEKCSGPDNLDIDAVRVAYELIMTERPFDVFHSTLTNSTEIILSTLARIHVFPTDVNQIVIILENPIFRKRRNHVLRQKLCTILSGLTPETKMALCQILSTYNSSHFEYRMGMLRDHLALQLKPTQKADSATLETAAALELFYEANMMAHRRHKSYIVPPKLFYVDYISKRINNRMEYEAWSMQQTHATSSSLKTLLDYPFLIDPASKVHILHLNAVREMTGEYQKAILHQARVSQIQKYHREMNKSPLKLPNSVRAAMSPFLVLEVSRENLIKDTLAQIKLKEADLKKPIKIKYIGGGEQGLDMGGVQKEFFQLLTASIFDPKYGMFTYSSDTRNLWINGNSLDSTEEFELVGIILGLAIYNGIILDIRFPNVIYKKLQGVALDASDLQDVEPTLSSSFNDLLTFEGDVEDVFCQSFEVTTSVFGSTCSKELIPGGADIPVTNQNREKFVRIYSQYILEESISHQFEPFSRGFHKVCGSEMLSLFRPDEIELLVCGNPKLNFSALEKSASYADGYHSDHLIIKNFWSIVHSMSLEKKRKLLHFITGSDRVPLKGLSHLPIVIQKNGVDSDRLPTAMTCFNRLLLPPYNTKEKLKNRLLVAIENCQGFGLT